MSFYTSRQRPSPVCLCVCAAYLELPGFQQSTVQTGGEAGRDKERKGIPTGSDWIVCFELLLEFRVASWIGGQWALVSGSGTVICTMDSLPATTTTNCHVQ